MKHFLFLLLAFSVIVWAEDRSDVVDEAAPFFAVAQQDSDANVTAVSADVAAGVAVQKSDAAKESDSAQPAEKTDSEKTDSAKDASAQNASAQNASTKTAPDPCGTPEPEKSGIPIAPIVVSVLATIAFVVTLIIF